MKNLMDFDGYQAVITYDPETAMFRGEFIGLAGGADFYARDVNGLRTEGTASLDAFLALCKEKEINPRRPYSGRFNIRIPPELHARTAALAAVRGKSLNQIVAEALDHETAD